MQRSKYIIISIIILAGIFSLIWLLVFKDSSNQPEKLFASIDKNFAEVDKKSETFQTISREVAVGNRYTNEEFGFSFDQSLETSIEEAPSGSGTVIIVHSKKHDKVFQIYIQDTGDSRLIINRDKVLADIPELANSNLNEIKVSKNVAGVVFDSEFETKKQKEVWFAYQGILYQITAPAESLDFLLAVLETWQFNM